MLLHCSGSLGEIKYPWVFHRIDAHGNHALGRELTLQQQARERVLDALLDGPLQGARAKHRVKADLGQLLQCGI